MSDRVLVIAPDKSPLASCAPARARFLLDHQRAAVFRTTPFTIILKEFPQSGQSKKPRFINRKKPKPGIQSEIA